MSSKTDNASASFLETLVPIIAWIMAKKPNDYTFQVRNTDDCWYPPTCKVMTELIPRLTNKDLEYSKDAAKADTDDAVKSIFDGFKDSTLPSIYYPQCIANAYNSTTMQLLADNAYAKTVAEAAKVKLDMVTKYAGIRVNDLQVMAQLIQAIKGSINAGTAQNDSQSQIAGIMNTVKLVTGIFSDNTNPNTK